jgi:hypothetical protein
MAVPEDAVAVLAVLAAKFAVVRPVAGAAGGPGVKGAAAAGQLRLRGSSGWRCRAWQGQLAVLAEQAGPAVTVMCFPPGAYSVNAALYRKEPVRCRIHPGLPPHASEGKRVL